jgi:hypothetical protein
MLRIVASLSAAAVAVVATPTKLQKQKWAENTKVRALATVKAASTAKKGPLMAKKGRVLTKVSALGAFVKGVETKMTEPVSEKTETVKFNGMKKRRSLLHNGNKGKKAESKTVEHKHMGTRKNNKRNLKMVFQKANRKRFLTKKPRTYAGVKVATKPWKRQLTKAAKQAAPTPAKRVLKGTIKHKRNLKAVAAPKVDKKRFLLKVKKQKAPTSAAKPKTRKLKGTRKGGKKN